MEAYSDRYYTTGVTYQADNQPTPTTVKGAGVDVSVLPIIGLSGTHGLGRPRLRPDRRERRRPAQRRHRRHGQLRHHPQRARPAVRRDRGLAARHLRVPVELYAPVACDHDARPTPCDADGRYELAPDGSYSKGKLLNTYVSESWERPTGCTARDVDGNPLGRTASTRTCWLRTRRPTASASPSFMQSIQFGPYPTDQGTPDANFGAAVNGNYGFGDGCFNGTLDATDPANPVCTGGVVRRRCRRGDYLVHVAIPDDATGNPMYKVTGEEDINIGNGDQIVPQVPPPACAGAAAHRGPRRRRRPTATPPWSATAPTTCRSA